MNDYKRPNYPDKDLSLPQSGIYQASNWWAANLDPAERVAVYYVTDAETITLVGYYDTVSDGNAAAEALRTAAGVVPTVTINWTHSSITQYQVEHVSHPDGRVALPSWIDAEAGV